MNINKFFLVLPLLLFLAFALGCDSDNDGVGEPLNGSEPEDRPSILGYEVITEEFLLDGNDCEDLLCTTEMECPSGKKLIYAGYEINSVIPGVAPVIQNNRPFNDGSGVTFAWGSPTLFPGLTLVRGFITLICAFAESV